MTGPLADRIRNQAYVHLLNGRDLAAADLNEIAAEVEKLERQASTLIVEYDAALNPDRTKTDPWGPKFVHFKRYGTPWEQISEEEYDANV